MAIKVGGTTVIDDSRNICNAGVVNATCFVGDGSGLSGISQGTYYCYGECIQAGDFVSYSSSDGKIYKSTGVLLSCTNLAAAYCANSCCYYGKDCSYTLAGHTAPFIQTSDGSAVTYGAIWASNCICCDSGVTCYELNFTRVSTDNWAKAGECSYCTFCNFCACTCLFGLRVCQNYIEPVFSTYDPASCKLFTYLELRCDSCCARGRGSLICFSNNCTNSAITGVSQQSTTCCFGSSCADYIRFECKFHTNNNWYVQFGNVYRGCSQLTINGDPTVLTSGTNWCIMHPSIINGVGGTTFPSSPGSCCNAYIFNVNNSSHNYIPVVQTVCATGVNVFTCCTSPCYCHYGSGSIFLVRPVVGSVNCVCQTTNCEFCTAGGPYANIATTSGVWCSIERIHYIGFDCAQSNVFFMVHDSPNGSDSGNARISFYCAKTDNTICLICQSYPAGGGEGVCCPWNSICCQVTLKQINWAGGIDACCTVCCTLSSILSRARPAYCVGTSNYDIGRPRSSTRNTFIYDGCCMLSFTPCNGNLCDIVLCCIGCFYSCNWGMCCCVGSVFNCNSRCEYKQNGAFCSNVYIIASRPGGYVYNEALHIIPHCRCDVDTYVEPTVSPRSNFPCFIGIAATTADTNACCTIYSAGQTTDSIFCGLTPGQCYSPRSNYCNWNAIYADYLSAKYAGQYGCCYCVTLPVAMSNSTVYVRT